MKVIYTGRPSRRTNSPPEMSGDVLELLSNDWDDFGFKTSFPVVCRIKNKLVELGMIRLLVEDEHNSATYLNRLLREGWNGVFPIPHVNYVSLPSEISFYEQLMGLLGASKTTRVARELRDASHLVNFDGDHRALKLVESKGFQDSLQRERGSQKAYLDGWKVLDSQAISVMDLGFSFDDVCGGQSVLNLKFQGDGLLPHDVNALIGPNGVGKSRVLHQIVEDWMSPSKNPERGFTKKPNLSQVVVVCYSPFETFPVDLEGKSLQDKDAYRYYGLRGRGEAREGSLGKIRLSHTFPKRNSAAALIECLADDQRYGAIPGWAKKVHTVESTLRVAFPFDFAAVQVDPRRRTSHLYRDGTTADPLSVDLGDDSASRRRYIPITSRNIEEIDHEKLRDRVLLEEGVTFFHQGAPVHLSSGQRLFAYIVINVLGAIRRNSLLLVDEPELFLHPTLEIQFVDLLKRILTKFNSKALLATHSEVTVREIPARCVHVFEKTDDGLVIKQPPFQTFGGDVQRISSYVFGDKAASKPFEKWIKDRIEELGSGQELLDQLGDQVNEELVIQIRALDRNAW
ncbi:ATP-binding protein [Arenimonas sp. MALMAid1274]|uniref:ATP-binding protein n=1 Tax=Arenimonas sp. MALMAid1274 TaxID=3411630 RepID=UPI003B9F827D